MNTAPIGVFDSGLGGLTTVKELRAILPGEDIVYFGDTGRVPYGSRGADTIIRYAQQDIAFLLSKGVKAIVAACGTVSSTLPKGETAGLPVPYMGVVEAAAKSAARATQTGKIGIIGTRVTVGSGSYRVALEALLPGVQCVENACPLFVPLVEEGHFAPDDGMAALAVDEYLAPIRASGIDTLILGCTHYPLLAPLIAAYMGEGVTLVDPGRETALVLQKNLATAGLLNPQKKNGDARYYVTDDASRFAALAYNFMGSEVGGPVERVFNIEAYSPKRILRGIQPLEEGNE